MASHGHGLLAEHLFFDLVEALTLTRTMITTPHDKHLDIINYVKPMALHHYICIVEHVAVYLFSVGCSFFTPNSLEILMIPSINRPSIKLLGFRLRSILEALHFHLRFSLP